MQLVGPRMSERYEVPRKKGQLVWCPADPSLGIGVVTDTDGPRVYVQFIRLQEARAYTTRGAEHVVVRYVISHGERVRDGAGAEHRVEKLVREKEGLAVYQLDDGREAVESELVPEVRDIGAKERLATLNLVHPEVVRARIQGQNLAQVGARPGFAAVLGSRVQWLPHQIDVATRAIERDPVRMLLADEVGLGKTVEAALIFAGLRYEGRANRVLILTPDSLCIQWLGELYRKSHELLVLMDEQRIEDALIDFPDLSPFEAHQRIVASIDRIARDEDLVAQVSAASWDLVIVDEAHHLRWRPEDGGNPAYRLVDALSQKTRHLLLLTATPMALDPAEYHALLRLLDRARFEDPQDFAAIAERVATIRDLGRQVAAAAFDDKPLPKATLKAGLELLEDDADDHAQLEELAAQKPGAKGRVELGKEVLAALRERHGLADFVVRNRRGPVGGLPERRPQTFPLEVPEAQDVLIEVGEGVMLDLARTLDDPREQNRRLGELLRALWATPRALVDVLAPFSQELVRELQPHIDKVVQAPLDRQGLPTGDARLRWLVELIKKLEPADKLLVFVESAIAVRALRDALEGAVGSDIAVFHRGLAPRDQDRQVAWFRDPTGPRVMLSTEAGGEGRNFQFCHKVVLYDMPWRPATIEQRIGRVDRVGQAHDVHVLVPYFKGGYEAAILKVMQESIGVLDRTVGGIDHALEYVSDRLAELILNQGGAEDWKDLFRDTSRLVTDAKKRISDEVDPILDHASFSPERAKAILAVVPEDLEARTELFVQRYADASKLAVRPRGQNLVALEGAPSAAGREDSDTGFTATFSRTHALDHEDVEFLSFGHPLIDQALEWAAEEHEASAALAICRGFAKDSAVFLWRFGLDLPDDVPEAAAYFDTAIYTFALDEGGKRVPDLEDLLDTSTRPLDRMDPAPLRQSFERWRKLIDQNHSAADAMAAEAVAGAVALAEKKLAAALVRREKHLKRAHARELAAYGARSKAKKAVQVRHESELATLAEERERLTNAIKNARQRLVAAVAVRLMRAKQVSA
jgi:ATP-dependent helicase HepA